MPGISSAAVVPRGKKFAARWYDETGNRRFRGGFAHRVASEEQWVIAKSEEIRALRRGDRPTGVPRFRPSGTSSTGSSRPTRSTRQRSTSSVRVESRDAAFGEMRSTSSAVRTRRMAGDPSCPVTASAVPSFRQVLEQAVTWQLFETNPTDRIRNRRVVLDEDREIRPFVSWDEVEAIAAELRAAVPGAAGVPRRYRDAARGGAGARVARHRPDEQPGERGARPFAGQDEAGKKSDRQRRRVPLAGTGARGARRDPRRLDSPLVFPAEDGGHIKLPTFRLRHWTPALRAAGIDHRRSTPAAIRSRRGRSQPASSCSTSLGSWVRA